jgi:hypothetical protein
VHLCEAQGPSDAGSEIVKRAMAQKTSPIVIHYRHPTAAATTASRRRQMFRTRCR